MGRQASQIICPTCGLKGVKKNGKTSAGKTRYRCTTCGASFSKTRIDVSEREALRALITYAQGKNELAAISNASRWTIRRRFAPVWDVPTPHPQPTGEVLPYVFIDGTWLAHGWTLLIARSQHHVEEWQWATSEKSEAWVTLLERMTPPEVVITDGGGGALKAIRKCWPNTRIQRCLVHIHRNNIADLTRHPKTMAGKALLALSRQLLKVKTIAGALKWQFLFHQLGLEYEKYFKERTYANDDPAQALWRKRTWRYTHERDRRVYYRIKRLLDSHQLFTFLEYNTPSTTNPAESVNALVARTCENHRGITENHMIAIIEWCLYSYTAHPLSAHQIYHNWCESGRPPRQIVPKTRHKPKHEGPLEIDHTIDQQDPYSDGLTLRKGWAGRYKP